MRFVFDLDDTVCDTDSYSEEYILNFISENNLPYKKIANSVRFAERKFDWDMEYALNWYKEYGDEMMLNFPCKIGAKELINELYDLGHRIVIATARSDDWHKEPVSVTNEWLKKEGIRYHKLYVGRIDKEKICEDEGANFFIDDDIKITKRVADYFRECSDRFGKSFIMNTLYNSSLEIDENVCRVHDFFEFKDILRNFGICFKDNK